MAHFSDDPFDLEEDSVIDYIYDDPFNEALDSEDFYHRDFEPMYFKKNLQKLNSEPWEMISSQIYMDRKLKGK